MTERKEMERKRVAWLFSASLTAFVLVAQHRIVEEPGCEGARL